MIESEVVEEMMRGKLDDTDDRDATRTMTLFMCNKNERKKVASRSAGRCMMRWMSLAMPHHPKAVLPWRCSTCTCSRYFTYVPCMKIE